MEQKKYGKKAEVKQHVYTVERVHQFEDGSVTFNMVVDGFFRVYGLRIYDGQDGTPFISFPARKGKDGKYWNHCYFPLTHDDVSNIADQIDQQLA